MEDSCFQRGFSPKGKCWMDLPQGFSHSCWLGLGVEKQIHLLFLLPCPDKGDWTAGTVCKAATFPTRFSCDYHWLSRWVVCGLCLLLNNSVHPVSIMTLIIDCIDAKPLLLLSKRFPLICKTIEKTLLIAFLLQALNVWLEHQNTACHLVVPGAI